MNNDKEDILIKEPALIEENITPKDLLIFAKLILAVIAVIFILGGLAELLKPNSGIFETCKTILPPIATLVIGFYFGKSN
jgi:hypothetical protein